MIDIGLKLLLVGTCVSSWSMLWAICTEAEDAPRPLYVGAAMVIMGLTLTVLGIVVSG